MKIKLDENLPEKLAAVLKEIGHDVDTVRLEGVAGQNDATVWQAAQSAHRFFITQDLDFSDARKYAPGNHAGIMVVRLSDPGLNSLLTKITGIFKTEPVQNWEACFVVVTDLKIRVRYPWVR
jgi:predicted nuclease of predicted toxin-antitoxin system